VQATSAHQTSVAKRAENKNNVLMKKELND
jgi:hypothetical protein